MPVATSPYSNNDYQAASNYRPYQLPINAIAQAITAQDKFWEEGAARVKSVYDNALNLKLSLEPNKQIRDKFMEEADKQLTKLSSMDLSDPSVQRQGFNIYKPLFQDEGILYDDAMTRHYEKVRNDALSFRSKNNGKEYSDTNMAYALDGYTEFVNSKDRMAGKKFYQNRKEYVPYYDYTGEANVALKNCHPNEVTKASAQGLDIVTLSERGLSSAKLNGCLGTLSDKAKKQLSIDGYITYKNNLPALRDAYVPILQNTKTQLDEENAAYSGILSNKDKLKNLTEEQLQKIGMTKDPKKNPDFIDVTTATADFLNSLDQKKTANQLRIDNLNKTIGQLTSPVPDFSSISGENFEPVAGSVHAKGYMDAYSASHSYIIHDEKRTGNASQMLIYRENRQDARQEDSQNFQMGMKMMDIEADRQLALIKARAIKGKGQTGELTAQDILDAASLNPAFEKDVQTIGDYDKLTEERNNLYTKEGELNNYYLSQLRGMRDSKGNSILPENIVSDKDFHSNNKTWQNWYNNFRRTIPENDPNYSIVKEYEDGMNKLKIQERLILNNQNEIDKLTDEQVKVPQVNNKPVSLDFGNGLILNKSAQDVINDIKSGKAKVDDGNFLSDIGLSYWVGSGGKKISYTINGKQYTIDADKVKNSGHIEELINQVNSYYKDVSSKRNEIAKSKTIVQKEGYSFPELNDKESEVKLRILQDAGINNPDDVTIGQTDLRGGVEVFLHPDNGSNPKFDANDVLKQLKTKYRDNFVEIPGGDKYHFILSGLSQLNMFNSPEMQTSELMIPYIRSMEKNVTNKNAQSTGLLPSTSPSKLYGMEITTSAKPGVYKYKVYDESNNILGIYDDRIRALQILTASLEGRFKENKIK